MFCVVGVMLMAALSASFCDGKRFLYRCKRQTQGDASPLSGTSRHLPRRPPPPPPAASHQVSHDFSSVLPSATVLLKHFAFVNAFVKILVHKEVPSMVLIRASSLPHMVSTLPVHAGDSIKLCFVMLHTSMSHNHDYFSLITSSWICKVVNFLYYSVLSPCNSNVCVE